MWQKHIDMPFINTFEACKVDLMTCEAELREKYHDALVKRIMRVRLLLNLYMSERTKPRREHLLFLMKATGIGKSVAYEDWHIMIDLHNLIFSETKAFCRWRYNELILETYQMAMNHGDLKTMARAASSYAKNNRLNREEGPDPKDVIVQPWTATNDCRVLGIKPIPHINDRIRQLTEKYRQEIEDDLDIEAGYIPPTTCNKHK